MKYSPTIIPIIIPAYEPDQRMTNLLSALKKAGFIQPCVIVNDGSGPEYDHYYKEAEEKYGAVVLKHVKNMGKGKALKTGFSYCLEEYPSLMGCVTADSDGQHTPEAIQAVADALQKRPDSLILGVRDFNLPEIPEKSRFGNNLTKKVFKSLYHAEISDTQTGLRAIPATFMKELLEVKGDRFEFETRMLICALKKGVGIKEVPIETIYDSKANHSTHFRPIVDSIRIYRCFGFAFGKFLLSSLSSSVIDISLFQLFCFMLKHAEVSWYVMMATVMARIISAIYNYLINYYVVFQAKTDHRHSAIRYLLLAFLQMLVSAGLTTLFVYVLHPTVEVSVKIPVDVVLFFASYQIQKKLVYR